MKWKLPILGYYIQAVATANLAEAPHLGLNIIRVERMIRASVIDVVNSKEEAEKGDSR